MPLNSHSGDSLTGIGAKIDTDKGGCLMVYEPVRQPSDRPDQN